MTDTDRRRFVVNAARIASGALALPLAVTDASALERWLASRDQQAIDDDRPADLVARDEAYWARVRALYDLQPDVVNLDHGWTNPAPRAAVEELVRNARALEALPAEQLPQQWETVTSTKVRAGLAGAMGVPAGEIALVRNATEALDTVLLGFPLARGDEVVCSIHDYYATLDALEQRRARDGVVLRKIEPPVPAPSMDALERLYAEAINDRTRLVLLTHPSNLTGQYLPARKIADRAHAAGAAVVVDGAQSLGILEDPVRSLDCDFYGASAHKWLGAPVGLGVLWMKPERVTEVWPLIPPMPGEKGMARFEWIGTAPEYLNPAAIPALALHSSLGPQRKAARLHYLATYLRERVQRKFPDARFYARPDMSRNLTAIEFPGMDPQKIQTTLRAKYGILVQGMGSIRSAPSLNAVRISPNVYTSPAELDRFVAALSKL